MAAEAFGQLSGVSRHDYLPFGEELGAGIGGRTADKGYSQPDEVRQKFTGAERDEGTELDLMGARYYSRAQGRFNSPDEFWKDSQGVDPQSWNKYAYVRNNPLRYVDPTGEKATVKIETDKEKKTGRITITATIAIFPKGKTVYSPEQLEEVKGKIDESTHSAWNGQFERDGITYSVTTCVTVNTYTDEESAEKSGADNVIGVSSGWAMPGKQLSNVDERWWIEGTGGPDTGTWNYDRVMNAQQAGHEFTHLLGAYNTDSDRNSVTYSPVLDTPVAKYGKATAADYRHALRGPLDAHLESGAQSSTFLVAHPEKVERIR